MKRSFLILIVLAAGLLLVVSAVSWVRFSRDPVSLHDAVDMRDKEEARITLTEDGFVPDRVRVRVGMPVVFSTTRDKQFWPASNPHPAHSIYPVFDPERPIAPDESWVFVPQEEGVWGFHDHLRSYYTGVLYVEQ